MTAEIMAGRISCRPGRRVHELSGRIQPSGRRNRMGRSARCYLSPLAGRRKRRGHMKLPGRAGRPLPSQPRKIDRLVFVERPVYGGQRIFEAARTIKQYGALVTADAAIREALFVGRIGSATL